MKLLITSVFALLFFIASCLSSNAAQLVDKLLDCQTLKVHALEGAHSEANRTLCTYKIYMQGSENIIMWIESMPVAGELRIVSTGYFNQ